MLGNATFTMLTSTNTMKIPRPVATIVSRWRGVIMVSSANYTSQNNNNNKSVFETSAYPPPPATGPGTPPPTAVVPPPPDGTATLSPAKAAALQEIQAAIGAARDAQKKGDFAAYGSALQRLDEAITKFNNAK